MRFTKQDGQSQVNINEVYFYKSSATQDLPTVQHKPAKWYDLRETLNINNAADDFDDDESLAMHAAYDGKTPIQSAHTLIDTIYVHRGTNVTLTLPDYLGDKTNNQSYQRWYNYMNEGTFKAEIIVMVLLIILRPELLHQAILQMVQAIDLPMAISVSL